MEFFLRRGEIKYEKSLKYLPVGRRKYRKRSTDLFEIKYTSGFATTHVVVSVRHPITY